MSALSYVGSLGLLLGRAFSAAPRRPWPKGAVLGFAVEIGNRSLPLVVTCMAFFGMVMVSHAAAQAKRIIGDFSLLGPDYFLLMVREFGPVVSAILVATRTGAGTAAEVATMAVTEQVEALELSAGEPIGELVTPRLLGGALGVTAVACVATLVTAISAALTATFMYGGNGWAFVDGRAIAFTDVLAGLLKACLSGIAIPLCACRAGLAARGGASAVGAATTSGVVQGCLAVILLDFAVGSVFLVLAP